MKECNKCHKLLDESCFSIKRASKDGLNTICKNCKKEYDKQFYQKEKEIIANEGKIEIKNNNNITNEYKTRTCEKCGKEFKVGKKSDGINYLVRKYCDNCSTRLEYKLKICEKCGKEFKVERAPDGRHFRNIKICDECKNKKTIICEKCGKKFEVEKYPGTNTFRKVKFCSPFCASTQTEFKNGKVQLIQKYTKCKYCGKSIKLKFNYSTNNWNVRTVCDNCLKPKDKPKFKEVICSVCNKKFNVELMPCGNYSNTQYCSDKCALEGFKIKCNKTCQDKYGVDYPCQTEQAQEKGNIISEVNKRFAKLLDKNNIQYEMEFKLDNFSYDFKIDNVLIEINPTYTHNSYYNHFGKVKDKNYHYIKSNLAIKYNYICICIWDWDNWNDILNLIKQRDKLTMKWTGIKLFYSKRSNKIESDNKDLVNRGYFPIYTDGYTVEVLK